MIDRLQVTTQVPVVAVDVGCIDQEQGEKGKRNAMVQRNKVKSIKWWDDKKSEDIGFPTHPPQIIKPVPDPVDKFESRIRGIPFDIESELKQLISNSSEVALELKEHSPCVANNVITETINNTY